jgi:putative cell wall-binding protein
MAGTLYRWRAACRAALTAVLLVTLVVADPAAAHMPDSTNGVVRLSGDDRVDTAVEISHALFPSGGAGAVVLARADGFADALAGSPFAAAKGAPLLLTASEALDERVAAELRRVLPAGRMVFLLGGPAALSPAVESAVAVAGFTPVRIFGETRYDTAVRIADRLQPTRLLLATGTDFADALAGGPAAGATGAVLLTGGSTLPPVVADYLARHSDLPRFALGGLAASAVPDAEAIVGADRFDTSARVAARFFLKPAVVGVASGEGFADALAGGAHIARRGGPLLLTASSELPPVVRSRLEADRSSLVSGFVYGGPAAIGEPVVGSVGSSIAGGDTVASLALLVPNGGEVVGAGTTQVIQWAYEGDEAPLKIELVSGSGTTQTIATNIPARAGTFTWPVPNVMGEDYRVRLVVEPPVGPSQVIVDLSDASFAIQDVTSPTLHDLEVTPTMVDTSSGPATLTFRARITDNLSGVSQGPGPRCCAENRATFKSPSGQSLHVDFWDDTLESGTRLDGWYKTTATLPRHSESGTWKLAYVKTFDAANNPRYLSEEDIEAAGLSRSFEQSGTGDGDGPILKSLQMSPTSVDTSAAPATIAFKARVTDAGSGVSPNGRGPDINRVQLVGPAGQSARAILRGTPTSGTANDGVYDFSLSLPQHSAQGTWRIDKVVLYDVAGNERVTTAEQVAQLGGPTTFEQTGPGDTTPPRLASLEITPRTVATSTGPRPSDRRSRRPPHQPGCAGAEPALLEPHADSARRRAVPVRQSRLGHGDRRCL